jgi:signal peptidase II
MTGPAASPVAQAVVSAALLVGVLVLYLRRFAPPRRWVLVALAVCVADQAAKALLSPALHGRRISLLSGWLTITYTENWEQGFGSSLSYLFLVTAVCVAALFFLYTRLARAGYHMSTLAELGCALMIGGYLGILLDRVRLGFVVDLLEFGRASTFVYNVADLAVFVAAALLLARGIQFLAEVRARRLGLQDEVI